MQPTLHPAVGAAKGAVFTCRDQGPTAVLLGGGQMQARAWDWHAGSSNSPDDSHHAAGGAGWARCSASAS